MSSVCASPSAACGIVSTSISAVSLLITASRRLVLGSFIRLCSSERSAWSLEPLPAACGARKTFLASGMPMGPAISKSTPARSTLLVTPSSVTSACTAGTSSATANCAPSTEAAAADWAAVAWRTSASESPSSCRKVFWHASSSCGCSDIFLE